MYAKFFKKFQENEPTEVSSDEKNILITAILIECAKEDGDFSDVEIEKIKKNFLKINLVWIPKNKFYF